MRKIFLVVGCWLLVAGSSAQTFSQKLQKAYQNFSNDSQLKHATSSLYVIDAKTGKVVFDKNSQIGLAGASTQKIIIASTAFELLGKNYRYKTEFGCDGKIEGNSIDGNLYFVGTCDPTLGSLRFSSTKPDSVLNFFYSTLSNNGIKELKGSVYLNQKKFETQTIPDGWIWEDIGNYYGAGAGAFNWNENQDEYIFKSGNHEGDSVRLVKRKLARGPFLSNVSNELRTGKPGTGDNAYFYFAPKSTSFFVRGTIPPKEDSFSVTASMTSPEWYFYREFNNKKRFGFKGEVANDPEAFERLQKYGGNKDFRIREAGLDSLVAEDSSKYSPYIKPINILAEYFSPTLDSIIYWFLKKSINLYGEALVKTFAYEKQGFGSTDSGVVIVKKFWKDKGMDEDELHIVDGSGLSPLNRVTTHAQVEILKYAKAKDWFPYFYDALPEYNNMKMKSGTISGVKGFCGYQTSKNGEEYIFSFLVNNYNGSPSGLVNKMYQVLNVLK